MQRAMIAIGACLVLALSTAAGWAASDGLASTTATSTATATGPAWCGFKEKAGSRVRCGYSSESDCKQAIGEPDAICIVDPYFTENRRAVVNG